jgi:hypothetical protein
MEQALTVHKGFDLCDEVELVKMEIRREADRGCRVETNGEW